MYSQYIKRWVDFLYETLYNGGYMEREDYFETFLDDDLYEVCYIINYDEQAEYYGADADGRRGSIITTYELDYHSVEINGRPIDKFPSDVQTFMFTEIEKRIRCFHV